MTSLNLLTGCVDNQCPTIQIEMGHLKSNNIEMRSIVGTRPFSIAYGGAGAGYAGTGGVGFKALPSGSAYGVMSKILYKIAQARTAAFL